MALLMCTCLQEDFADDEDEIPAPAAPTVHPMVVA